MILVQVWLQKVRIHIQKWGVALITVTATNTEFPVLAVVLAHILWWYELTRDTKLILLNYETTPTVAFLYRQMYVQ